MVEVAVKVTIISRSNGGGRGGGSANGEVSGA